MYYGDEPTARVGADLKAARERLGWSLPAVSATLRIRLPYLEAIEAGRISVLPGNAYAVGFIRTYAQSLGLDPDEIARRFKAEAAEVNRKTELAFPAPVPDRGIPAGAVVLVGAVIAILAYVGWYRFSSVPSGAPDVVQPVPARLAPLAETASGTGPSGTATSDAAKTAGADPSNPAPASTTATASLGAPAQGQSPAAPNTAAVAASNKEVLGPPVPPAVAKNLAAAAGASQLASASALGAPPPPPVLASPGTSTPLSAIAGDNSRIQVKAIAEAWVQVREKQGNVLLNRVLRSGETWPVPTDKGPLLMTTGNAGGTELIVDGTAQPPLGGDGIVKRDIPLDVAALADPKTPGGSSGNGPSLSGKPAIRTN